MNIQAVSVDSGEQRGSLVRGVPGLVPFPELFGVFPGNSGCQKQGMLPTEPGCTDAAEQQAVPGLLRFPLPYLHTLP